MYKIVIVNESFSYPIFYRRWELFAEKYKDFDVTLLTPETDKIVASSESFGKEYFKKGSQVEKDNFHIRLFRKRHLKLLGWYSPDFKRYLKEIKPDVVYNVGHHHQFSLCQLIYLTKKYLPNSKVIAFSMRGPNFNLERFKDKFKPVRSYIIRRYFSLNINRFFVKYLNKRCDAIFCHYPDAMKCFRDEGYKGPIYMQTQVGVNPELFHQDDAARKEIRELYHIKDDEFVFGSATRFTFDKGLDDIIKALPSTGTWKYLMLGSGTQANTDRIKNLISERGLEDKIIMPGFIPLEKMYKYWNAIDCMLHVPKTVTIWCETFSIALVQCMITKKPVIGDDSGSVPYQIGPDGIIVPEGNIDMLKEKMEWALSHQDELKVIGEKMFERANNCFSIFHLNDMFYDTLIEDVLKGEYDEKKSDMTKYRAHYETI